MIEVTLLRKLPISIFMSLVLIMSFASTALADKPHDYEQIPAGFQSDSFEFEGYERTFQYYVPSSYSGKKSVPLMLSFHGRGSNSDGQIGLTGFEKVAEKEGFIVVFPDSTEIDDGNLTAPSHRFQWNDGRTDTPQYRAGVDDVAFTSELIDYFEEKFNIDPSRIYASGMSNGSIFSNRLAVELSDRIAGIGAVTGPLAPSIAEKAPKGPITVVLFMGDQDPIVPYNGAPSVLLGAESTVDYWVEANDTASKPRVTYLPQTAEGDPTKIRREVYSGGKHGTEVIFYKMEGAGHTWPGGPQYLPPEYIGLVSNQINGSQLIWDELKTHRLPGAKSQGKQLQLAESLLDSKQHFAVPYRPKN
ncbi:alpha/beta hydrolase family esterase [Halobacillus amylolyticus]|uniref:Alpha/beta hydrolase-fold protein n=1 Tax=Halobacillus amylolyticus TaxID=2932259 RepID=A0ABY4H9E7_9BACI|nr:PHB depolymerase family esterase [Halobacillus amylolyticus]UOR10560.1 alpha/beta hydrolase-fold protein [Halobacillus amylolyticus]